MTDDAMRAGEVRLVGPNTDVPRPVDAAGVLVDIDRRDPLMPIAVLTAGQRRSPEVLDQTEPIAQRLPAEHAR